MLLTLSTTHQPATDLGYLLHKHPDRFQSFSLSFGQAHVFYPEATNDRCTACLVLDVDPVGMVRGRRREQRYHLGQYVNDRPYVASSFLSVALSQVFGTALAGRCKDRPELVTTPIPLTARLDVLPVRGGDRQNTGLPKNDSTADGNEIATDEAAAHPAPPSTPLHRLFEPLGYTVEAVRHPLDAQFPEWGESPYYSVTIRGTKTLAELLTHLYVLIPVFDNDKHYFVGEDELEKLLSKGAPAPQRDASTNPTATGWLARHPEKEFITRRYLRHRPSLFRQALARLIPEEAAEPEDAELTATPEEQSLERPLSLNEQRLGAVMAALRASGARRVLDLGCGEGKLIRELLRDRQFENIVGLDVSIRSLELAQKRLKLERLPEKQADRVTLLHGSLIYRDRRLEGFDAASVVEVIEHLDPPRLAAFERVLFEFARPKTIVLTTPNREYNVMWDTLPAGRFRHSDHRFEWTRAEFQNWSNRVAQQHGYNVRFLPIGPEDEQVGAPTQMGVFERE